MQVREEKQRNEVAEPVTALTAVARPIIASVLHSISAERLQGVESREDIPLRMLGVLRNEGDGDVGVAFEYAVHDAMANGNEAILDRVSDALSLCRIKTDRPSSIFFAMEKAGSQRLINTQLDLITDDSRVLSGNRGQPVKLKNYLNQLAAAFRRPSTRPNLPQSIRGLWKADLFLGAPEREHWVGTSVRINPRKLEGAHGLRVAIVPAQYGRSDALRKDESRNLIVCPVPYDPTFMLIFWEGWRIVQSLMESDFRLPADRDLPAPEHRQVAQIFAERRDLSVKDAIESTAKFAQPHLLETDARDLSALPYSAEAPAGTGTLVAPIAYGFEGDTATPPPASVGVPASRPVRPSG
ncbi:hypothetical protein [Egicoccus halophilus]|uniref:Uncharacterized protein n=1 Tax=Egicoccus halophilus TaxID=1670830 RepID=A0A8J3AB97_9ACTN|nr:hypothetical protein [Egicoccus halophilus]GGI07219.1 hypothetical protein GCM10011354_22990 [Egicoccus halophilus]